MKLVVAALILREDEILICQRAANGPMPLKWEFPGGKVESGESPQDALARELNEELSIRAEIGVEVARIKHEYKNGFFVDLIFLRVDRFNGSISNNVFADVRWEKLSQLSKYDFLEADLKLIEDLAAGALL